MFSAENRSVCVVWFSGDQFPNILGLPINLEIDMANDIPTSVLAVSVPRPLRLRLDALRLARGTLGDKTPTIRDLVLEAIGDLIAKGTKKHAAAR